MTTHSPSYYRDLMQRVVLMESAGDLPQWFRDAWSRGAVQCSLRTHKGTSFVEFYCRIALTPWIPATYNLSFHILENYKIQLGPEDGWGYPLVKFQNINDYMRYRGDFFYHKAVTALTAIFHYDPRPLKPEWLDPNFEVLLEHSILFYRHIKHTLSPVAEELYVLGISEADQ